MDLKSIIKKVLRESQMEKVELDFSDINNFKREWLTKGNEIFINPKWPGPDELNNGGDVDKNILHLLMKISDDFGEWIQITGGNDVYHQKKSKSSSHVKGNAIDFITKKGSNPDVDVILRKYQQLYPGFTFINEYERPSAKATGGHYHIQYEGPDIFIYQSEPSMQLISKNIKIEPSTQDSLRRGKYIQDPPKELPRGIKP